MTEVFRTVHGSHLYGLNHADSDHDLFIVTFEDRGKARQTINSETGVDTVRVGWRTFLDRAWGGSHQSCEALFSPYKEYTPEGESLRAIFDATRVGGSDVFKKYERTIVKFCFGDFKRRRHAVRLAFNLNGLRECGRFDPVMTEGRIRVANELAQTHEGEALIPWLLH